MPNRLRNLRLKRVSLVDNPANEEATVVLFKSADGCGDEACAHCAIEKGDLGSESRGNLSDSDFAAVWTDASGKKQRKLPIHDAAHVRNALARFNQTDMPADVKGKAKAKLEAAARRLGIGQGDKSMAKKDDDNDADDKKKDMDDVAARARKAKEEEDSDDEAEKGMCSKCMKAMSKGAAFCPSCGAKVVTKEAGMDKDRLDPEVRKAFDKLEADLAAANEKLAAAVVTKKAEETDEDVLKGLSPAVRAIVEKSKADAADALAKVALLSDTITKREDEVLEKSFIDEAKGLVANIAGDPKVLGPILKRVSQGKTTAEDLTKLREVLKAANAAAKPTLRAVVGSGEEKGGGEQSAQAQIETLAKQLIEKAGDKKPSFADAMDTVVRENPDLWKRYQAEAMHTTVAVNEEE